MAQKNKSWALATLVVHGENKKFHHNAINTPIYYASTFEFDNFEKLEKVFKREEQGFIYTRWSNPTRHELESKMALLEKGEAAVAFASGMGAISATLLTYLQQGDHIILDNVVYGCTFSLITKFLVRYGITYTALDLTDLTALRNALQHNTKVLFFETIANPTLKLVDISAVNKLVHEQNKNIKIIVDNTFATPYNLNPLLLGADVVIHSATKLISGHNDALCGIVVSSSNEIMTIKQHGLKDIGANLSPMDAYLIIRGLATMVLRIEKATNNAQQIAQFLQGQPLVKNVIYLGLAQHPQHQLAVKILRTTGTIVAFEFNGTKSQVKQFFNKLQLIKLAVSFGSVQTLIEHPMTQTHKPYLENDLAVAKISPQLIRIACGIEDSDDLINDLKNAFANI